MIQNNPHGNPEGKLPGRDASECLTEATQPISESNRVASQPRSTRIECDPLLGKQVGPYTIKSLIAHGGMGSVYLASRHTGVEKTVAVKFLASERLNAAGKQRFELERQALATLSHPNIAQLIDGGTEGDGRPYLVMTLIEGVRITDYCELKQASYQQRAQMLFVVARAIHYAHRRNFLHRDLKPGNILVTDDGIPIVTDFSLTKHLDDQADAGPTSSGATMGSPRYMAPEQLCSSSRPAGRATDVYGLGAVLYELLTGRPPFRGRNALDTLRQVESSHPIRPRILNAAIPRDLENICLKCLRKDPQRRYASAAELADDLQRFQAGLPVTARPIGLHERCWRLVVRHPAISGIVLTSLTLVLLCLAGLLALWRISHDHHMRSERNLELALDGLRQLTQIVEDHAETRPQSARENYGLLKTSLQTYRNLKLRNQQRSELKHREAVVCFLMSRAAAHFDLKLAQQSAREALNLFGELNQADPHEDRYRFDLFHTHAQCANLANALGDQETRLGHSTQALDFIRGLASEFPQQPDYLDAYAHHDIAMGQILRESGQSEQALAYFEHGLQTARTLSKRQPEQPRYLRNIALNALWLARTQWQLDLRSEANASINLAQRISTQLVEECPEIVAYHLENGEIGRLRLLFLYHQGDSLSLEEGVRQLLSRQGQISLQSPGTPEHFHELLRSQSLACYLALLHGSEAQAEHFGQNALRTTLRLRRFQPSYSKAERLAVEFYSDAPLEVMRLGLPRLPHSASDYALAMKALTEKQWEQAAKLLEQSLDNARNAQERQRCCLQLALLQIQAGEVAEAQANFEQVNRQVNRNKSLDLPVLWLLRQVEAQLGDAEALAQTQPLGST